MASIKTSTPEIRVGLDSISKPKKMSSMNVSTAKTSEATMPKNKKMFLKRRGK
jgi:hypothetical protein